MPPARPRLIVNASCCAAGRCCWRAAAPRKAYPGCGVPGRPCRGREGADAALAREMREEIGLAPRIAAIWRHRRSRRDRALSHDAGDRLGRRRAAHHRPRTHRPALGAGRRGRGLAGISRWRRIGRCWPGCCHRNPAAGQAARHRGAPARRGDDGGRLRDLPRRAARLEATLCDEVRHKASSGRGRCRAASSSGRWPEVWRANLWLRGAGRVLARIARFGRRSGAARPPRARVPWGSVLRADIPFTVEASCTASRIYHSGAAAERIATAIRDTLGAAESPDAWR